MCAGADIHGKKRRPSDFVGVWLSQSSLGFYVWAGFATTEKLWWWKRQGKFVDFPAHAFAERNDETRELHWEAVPPGMVIRALVTDEKPVLKVVTRAATPEEVRRFGHDRMPVIEPPLFSAEVPVEAPPERAKRVPSGPVQGELF